MVKRFACVFSVSISAWAQTVYEPVPGTGYCDVTAATSTTPVRVTVSDISLCGIRPNQTISVWGLRGITAAWSNPGTTPGTTASLARIVKNTSGNSFDLYDLASAPVSSGGGTYAGGGKIRRVMPMTLRSGPILDLDGTGGPKLAAMTNTSATGRKNQANIRYTLLKGAVDAYVSLGNSWGQAHSKLLGGQTLNAALAWLVDGNTSARDAALFDLRNPDQLTGGIAAAEAVRDGGHPATSIMHYGTATGVWNFARAATILQSQLSAAEKATFLNFMFAGYSWAQGGVDYSGSVTGKPPFKLGYTSNAADFTHGTVSLSGATVTGSGTAFTADIAVGDIVYIPHPSETVYALPYKVTAIGSDTSMTVTNPLGAAVADVHYSVQQPWTPGMAGWWWEQCHYPYVNLCGLGSDSPSAVSYLPPGSNEIYGYYGLSYDSNLILSHLHAYYGIALVGCQWGDQRACWLAGLVSTRFYDDHYRHYLPRNSGGETHSNRGYNSGWVRAAIDEWQYYHYNSYTTPNIYLTDTWIDWSAAAGTRGWIPGLGYAAWAENTDYQESSAFVPGNGLMFQYLFPARAASQWGNFWVNQRGHEAAKWSDNGSVNAGPSYIMFDPALAATPPPLAWVMNTTERAACLSVFGSARCDTERGSFGAYSRTGWTPGDTVLTLEALSPECEDHCVAGPGQLQVYRNGLHIWGGNNGAGEANSDRSYVAIGNDDDNYSTFSDTMAFPYNATPSLPPSSLMGKSSATYVAARNDLTPWYRAAAAVVSAGRTVIHFKAGGRNLILLRDEGYTSVGKAMKAKYTVPQVCGAAASGTCASVSRAGRTFANQSSSGNAGVVGQVIGLTGPVSPVIMQTENASDTDLGYAASRTGGRFTVCRSADGISCDATNTAIDLLLPMLPTGGTGSLAPMVTSRTGSYAVFEYKDTSLPAVAFMSHAGTLITAASATTTHAGLAQVIVLGLAPGTYSVRRNNTDIVGCTSLDATAGANVIECPSVASGAITVAVKPRGNPH